MEREEALSSVLAIVRIMIGLMFIWAFFDKLIGLGGPTPHGCGFIDGFSPTHDYLCYCNGWFSGLFNWLAQFSSFCDVLLMVGFLGCGICFILGFAKKISVVAFTVMLVLFWLAMLPMKEMPLIDYHSIYIFAMIAVYFGNGFERWGIEDYWANTWLPRRYPIFK